MTYRINNAAYDDLEKIWLYTAENWSLKQADKYLNLIMDGIEILADSPKLDVIGVL
ncbi:MAG TPA: type II toxin-antitoxin system RelE/ParE family toxin [Saprospiraceae bacterium]|nr:type II toxin-antitoxin system RelE/ParE family toxin [Saprospiraceae bacterium]